MTRLHSIDSQPLASLAEPQYLSWQVAKIAGVTFRQIQWWDEKGVLPVRQTLHQRIFTEDDLFLACMIKEFRAKRMSLQSCRRVLAFLRKSQRNLAFGAHAWIISDGKRRHALAKSGYLQDTLDKFPCPVYVVYLDAIRARLEERARSVRKQPMKGGARTI